MDEKYKWFWIRSIFWTIRPGRCFVEAETVTQGDSEGYRYTTGNVYNILHNAVKQFDNLQVSIT